MTDEHEGMTDEHEGMTDERRMTVAYTMNKMAPGIIGSDRSETYLRAIDDALE
jgi:hypothetical protein